MSVLDRIVDDTRDEVKRRRKDVPLKDLEKALERRAEGFRPFSEALTRPGVSLIADGSLKPQIGMQRSWREFATVAEQLRDRRVAGKAVLVVD